VGSVIMNRRTGFTTEHGQDNSLCRGICCNSRNFMNEALINTSVSVYMPNG
jgi:hypothetical protein